MESNQKKIAAVAVVVVIVIVAAAAAYILTRDNGNNSDDNSVTFLIQDNYGVYFWVEGSGDTVYDAWVDAMTSNGISYVPSYDTSGVGYGIQSMFGLEMTNASGTWVWWQQFTYADDGWSANTVNMNEIKSTSCNYVALVYGDSNGLPYAYPMDAVVWDGSTSGTVFTIQSYSGMYFKINGSGTTVYDAWVDATTKYKVTYESSEDSYGTFISSIYGLDTYYSDTYTYWSLYVVSNGAWDYAPSYMTGIQSSDCSHMLVVYVYESQEPTLAPVTV